MNIIQADLIKASEKWDIPLHMIKHWYRIYNQDNGQEKLALLLPSYRKMTVTTHKTKEERQMGLPPIDNKLYKRCLVFLSENMGMGTCNMNTKHGDIGLSFTIENEQATLVRKYKEETEYMEKIQHLDNIDDKRECKTASLYKEYKAGIINLTTYNQMLGQL